MTDLLDRLTGWLPWRHHVHLDLWVRCGPNSWDRLFDLFADAAHDLDEQLFCSGSYSDPAWRIAHAEVLGFRMTPAAADALRTRVEAAVRDHPGAEETLTRLRHRCRCT